MLAPCATCNADCMLRWLDVITSALHRSHTGAHERRAVDRILVPGCPSCHSRDNVRVRSRSWYAISIAGSAVK